MDTRTPQELRDAARVMQSRLKKARTQNGVMASEIARLRRRLTETTRERDLLKGIIVRALGKEPR